MTATPRSPIKTSEDRMKVLHVVTSAERRGAEVFAADLVRALNGIDQRVAVLARTDRSAVEFDVPVTWLETTTSHRFDLGFRAWVRLRYLERQWRPDVVQAHGGEALKACFMARLQSPVVYRRIGCAPRALRSGLRRRAYARIISRADMTVAVANAVARESIALFDIPSDRIVTIPNAVDADRVTRAGASNAFRDRHGIPADAPVFLSLGALTWEKDPACHLRVGSRVRQAVPASIHVFAGEGQLRPQLRAQTRALDLDGRVKFVGMVTDVGEALRAADVVLFASRPDGMEGMPGILIEAAMLGVPAAAYEVAGVSEVLVNGSSGLSVKWGDEPGLADATSRLLSDAALRQAMGIEARRIAFQQFEIGRVAPIYLDLYQRLSRSSAAHISSMRAPLTRLSDPQPEDAV
jgi:glycosyltransferase involved in cell wall biosynthesis